MKKLLSVVLALVLVLSLAACGAPAPAAPAAPAPTESSAPADAPAEPTAPEAPAADGAKKVMGVVMPNATHGFTGESIKHAEASVKELSAANGFEYKFLTSAESSEQNNQLDTLINEKVDCIVMWPHNGDELRSGAQKVMDAGIPLVIYDRLITDFVPTVESMGDNSTIGEMTGTYFNKYFAEDIAKDGIKILEFKGDNSTVPQQRSDGFWKTADKKITLLQPAFSTDWQRAKAQEQMETVLNTLSAAEVESLRAVFTHDDEVALGVLDAITSYTGSAKLNIKLVSGVGGRKENLDTFAPMKEKGIDQVTYAFSPSMVRNAIQLGADILAGETPSGLKLVPTVEIDNTTEAAFRESDIYKVRYSI